MYQFILLRSYAHVTKINEVIDECNSPNEIRHRRKYEIARNSVFMGSNPTQAIPL